ncbi:MAG: glycosyltransferase family 2 protein [Alphaproteobacteria bacterium]
MTSGATDTTSGKATIAVIIPCFRETAHVVDVISNIGDDVSRIFVIDDACPDRTGEHVRNNCRDGRVEVIVHERNTGVGGATMTGYAAAIAAGADIIVKLDGDGQMDPSLIPDLLAPVLNGQADYTKGNRFYNLDGVSQMPALRIAGNLALSLASKLSSGYWNVFDPTNGFTAIHAKAAKRLSFDKIAKGFFFESDMLYLLYMMRAVVADVPMPARYGGEESSLKIRNIVIPFAAKHWSNAVRRILYTYFIRDFGIASVELVLGKLLFLFGVVYGILGWMESSETGIPATAGTVFLAALPIILGSQMLIAFINNDARNVPNTVLHKPSSSPSHLLE